MAIVRFLGVLFVLVSFLFCWSLIYSFFIERQSSDYKIFHLRRALRQVATISNRFYSGDLFETHAQPLDLIYQTIIFNGTDLINTLWNAYLDSLEWCFIFLEISNTLPLLLKSHQSLMGQISQSRSGKI